MLYYILLVICNKCLFSTFNFDSSETLPIYCSARYKSSHVLIFCVNFERHICTHITTSIKCYLVSLRYVYVPFTYILCQSNWHIYISTNFQNVNKPSTLQIVIYKEIPGPVFTKGLRLSQVLCLNPVLKLRLLSQLSFVLKPYSQRVT